MPQKELPEKYYLDYYQLVIKDVRAKYMHLLKDHESALLNLLFNLSENALCLWIRFVNRKKNFLRIKDLKYKEIKIESALKELDESGLIKQFSIFDKKYFEELAFELTKKSIVDLLKPYFKVSELNKKNKSDLFQLLLDNENRNEFIRKLSNDEYWFCELKDSDKFLKYLYFGYICHDLTPFVIRDLGTIKYEDFEDSLLAPRFETREEIEIAWDLALASEHLYFLIKKEFRVLEIYHWFDEWNRHLKKQNWTAFALRRYNRIVIKMAYLLERSKQVEFALEVYKNTDKHPSRERRCRLYANIYQTEKAILLCEEILLNPENAHEYYFAQYFKEKLQGGKNRLPTSLKLSDCKIISISKEWKYRVEEGLGMFYIEKGYLAIHSENWVWRALLGLLLWDVIYDFNDEAFTSPFQRVPSSFMSKEYYLKRKEKIDNAIKVVDNKKLSKKIVKETFKRKFGIANPLVIWEETLLEFVFIILKFLNGNQLKRILTKMIENPADNLRGFPDLMIWNKHELRFIEVKGPGDNLSYQQLFWIEFISDLGVDISAEKVVFKAQDLQGF